LVKFVFFISGILWGYFFYRKLVKLIKLDKSKYEAKVFIYQYLSRQIDFGKTSDLFIGNEEVGGSIPLDSTITLHNK